MSTLQSPFHSKTLPVSLPMSTFHPIFLFCFVLFCYFSSHALEHCTTVYFHGVTSSHHTSIKQICKQICVCHWMENLILTSTDKTQRYSSMEMWSFFALYVVKNKLVSCISENICHFFCIILQPSQDFSANTIVAET